MSVNLPSPSAAPVPSNSGSAAIASSFVDESGARPSTVSSSKEFNQVFSSVAKPSSSRETSASKDSAPSKSSKAASVYSSQGQASAGKASLRKASDSKADAKESEDDSALDATASDEDDSAASEQTVLSIEPAAIQTAVVLAPADTMAGQGIDAAVQLTTSAAVSVSGEGRLGAFGTFRVFTDGSAAAAQGVTATPLPTEATATTAVALDPQSLSAPAGLKAQVQTDGTPDLPSNPAFQSAVAEVADSQLVSSVAIRATSSDAQVVEAALQQAGLSAEQPDTATEASVSSSKQIAVQQPAVETVSAAADASTLDTGTGLLAKGEAKKDGLQADPLASQSNEAASAGGEKNAVQLKDGFGKRGQGQAGSDKKNTQTAGIKAERSEGETNGIFGAKTGETMYRDDSSSTQAARSLLGTESSQGPVATSGSQATSTQTQAQQTDQVNQAYASRTLDAVKEIAEKLQTNAPRTVEFDLSLKDGHQISVSLAFRGGTVHTTISTNSAELRDTLSKEWATSMPSMIQGTETLRVAQPQFSDSSSSRDGTFDPNGQASRQQQWQQQASEAQYSSFSRSSSSKSQAQSPNAAQHNQPTAVADSNRRLNAIA